MDPTVFLWNNISKTIIEILFKMFWKPIALRKKNDQFFRSGDREGKRFWLAEWEMLWHQAEETEKLREPLWVSSSYEMMGNFSGFYWLLMHLQNTTTFPALINVIFFLFLYFVFSKSLFKLYQNMTVKIQLLTLVNCQILCMQETEGLSGHDGCPQHQAVSFDIKGLAL